MSMLDGFLGSNQVMMTEEDKYKTTFTTPWGTYALKKIHFGLKNVGATFQREMDHAFKDLIGKFMADCQYNLTMNSKPRQLHHKHLREVFVRCRMFGISLNMKKCLFAVLDV